ncbi:MAG TPA: ribonuclease D [Gemmatimonadales bacterium]|nr:ribonuclease D [Gemmatimonadales bacterium]
MTEARYVATPEALAQVISAFRRESPVAVDTEAASFHRFVDRVYLVQLSTRRATAIIDPLAVTDLTPIGTLLADRDVEKIFHDADYDLRTLDRDFGFRAVRLFDTRVAAQLAGEPAIGLAALLEKYLGLKLSKTHQKADWSQRPLTPGMLEYAAGDTAHLPDLRDALEKRLRELSRWDWATEEFARLEALRWTGPADNGDAYLRIKGAKALRPRQLATLRELSVWREGLARKEDRAQFRIIGNESLLGVSRAQPRTADDLTRVPDLPASLARRHGPALLEAVERAAAIPEKDLPVLERPPRPPHDPAFDLRSEKLKVARNARAVELGIDPGVLCGRVALEAVARAHPKDRAGLARIGELRRWQLDAVGDALLQALV